MEELSGKEVEGSSLWVKDGSLDFKARPACSASTGGWKASLFIMSLELSEKTCHFSIVSNLITYLTNVLHQGLASSAKNVNYWHGAATVLPLLGGFLADSYFNKYWMVVGCSLIYLMGLALLTMAVSLPTLKPPPCPAHGSIFCGNASSAQMGVLFFVLYMISVGAGGLKPSIGSFGPDQFDEQNPKEKLQKHSFFNWLFFAFSCGILLATTVVVYVQENVSWGAGFGSVTAAFGISLVVFLCGTTLYRHKASYGSPITRIVQVFVAAARNRELELPSDAGLLHENFNMGAKNLEHTGNYRWIDKAAVKQIPESIDSEGAKGNPWKLCTVTQVEEAKQIVRITPIWLTCLTFAVVLTQQSTFFVKQSSTMDRKIGYNFKLPPASVFAFGIISNMLFLPLYDRVLVPAMRRITGHERGITILQRIGTGLVFSILGLVSAAVVESKRLQTAKTNGLLEIPHEAIPLSVFWLTPQYIVFGIANTFALVGMQEFFYSQVPDTMKSLGIALYLSVIGVGSFLCSFLITIVHTITGKVSSPWFVYNLNKCHLNYFFWLLAFLSATNVCMFMYFASRYRYKKIASDIQNSGKSYDPIKSKPMYEVERVLQQISDF